MSSVVVEHNRHRHVIIAIKLGPLNLCEMNGIKIFHSFATQFHICTNSLALDGGISRLPQATQTIFPTETTESKFHTRAADIIHRFIRSVGFAK